MANEKHLTRLKKGVKGWNAWREKHREVRPDLKGADFSGADLSGIDLVEAYLSKANLSKANLAKAQLVETDLSQANLCEANLTEAVLIGAHLEAADLKAANLVDADLIEANLHGADLRGTNLQGILLFETILTDTNLTGARGLDSCSHGGPSTIDFRTLMKSGRLPLEFLRGCGLPDNFIEYLPSLLNEPLQFYSCFISYSTKDQEFAERLHADLQNKGVRCWFAPHDIQGGKKLHEQIDQAIRVHDRLLLLLSEHSMNSEWVKTEIANARRREVTEKMRVLFPIRLVDFETLKNWTCFDADTGKDSAREIREYFIPDFSHWKDHDAYQEAFTRLLRDLKAADAKSEDVHR